MTAAEHARMAVSLLDTEVTIEEADRIIKASMAHSLVSIALSLDAAMQFGVGPVGAGDLRVVLTGWDGDYPLPTRSAQ